MARNITASTAVDMTKLSVRQALANPMDWSEQLPVHEWRYYVNDGVKAIWHTFSPEQKIAIMQMADDIADREEYD